MFDAKNDGMGMFAAFRRSGPFGVRLATFLSQRMVHSVKPSTVEHEYPVKG